MWCQEMHSTAQSLVWDLGVVAGIVAQHGKCMCQGGKPGTGKLYGCVGLCGSGLRMAIAAC